MLPCATPSSTVKLRLDSFPSLLLLQLDSLFLTVTVNVGLYCIQHLTYACSAFLAMQNVLLHQGLSTVLLLEVEVMD